MTLEPSGDGPSEPDRPLDEGDEPAPVATARSEETGSRRRRTAVAVLLVLACITEPLAATAIFVSNQLTDTDRYVRTVKPLAEDPAIREVVATDVTQALFARVDIAAQAREALPPRAQFLAVPLASGLQTFTETTVRRILESERFQELWVEINRLSHAQLRKLLTGEGTNIQTANGRVVLDLTPVLTAVKTELAERGITVFERVPASVVSTSFVLMESKQLERTQRGVRLLDTLSWLLPLLVAVFIGAAVAISRRRRRTVLQAGLGIAASMVVLGLLLLLGRSIYVDKVAGALPEDAARAFFDITVHWFRIGIRAIFAIALLVAAGAFLTGPSRAAVGIRRRFSGVVGGAAGETGVRSSATGRWVGENRTALRIASILVPAVVLFLWNAPTPAVLVVLVVIALLSLLAIEFVAAPQVSADGRAQLGA